jgi:hypothetical protein
MKNIDLVKKIESIKTRSKWDQAVKEDALELINAATLEGFELKDCARNFDLLEQILLNGAKDWHQFSWGGSALCYNFDIAQRYCTDSGFKRTKNGQLRPNKNEDWLDVQARALFQAFLLIKKAVIGG